MKLNRSGSATTKNEQILIVIVGVVAIVAMCYLFIISPGMDKSKPTSQEIKNLELKLKEVENIDQAITAKQKELDALMIRYNEAATGLPKTDRYPQLFADIEKMAVESGLTAVKGTFYEPRLVNFKDTSGENQKSEDTNLQGMKYIQVDYYIENDIEKVLTFVDKLENDDRIADMGAIKQNTDSIVVQVFFYLAGGEEKEEYDFN